MNAMKCILFFALAAAVYAQVGITEPDEDLIVPEATQEVAPMEFVDEEALQQASEEAHAKATSYLEKAGAGACSKLSDATAQEVKDNVKAQQAILDKIDKGANCPQRGQAAVTAMKGKLTAAENTSKDAAKKYNDALKVDVDFGKRSFDSLTEGNCNTFFNSAAYTNAKKKVSDAKKKKEEAAGKVTQAKKSLKTAEDTAKASVKICQCDTFKAHEKALADANAKVKAANTKAWTEAAHLKCVLAGKTTNSCTVPPLPKVKATSLATGVDAGKCSAWAGNPQCKNAAVQGGETRNYLQAMKTISGDSWNAGCYMKAEVPAIRKQDYMIAADWSKGSASQGYTMWGFEDLKKGTTPHQYQGIDFAAYCWNNIGLYIFEKGSQRAGNIGPCNCKTSAKVATIMRVNGNVEYWMMVNGGWKACHTSAGKAQNVPYVIDESIYQKGSKISVQLYVGKGNPGSSTWNQAT